MRRLSVPMSMCVVLVLIAIPCLADYGAEVTADNPMCWWRFEDPSSAQGSTAADSAGVFPGIYTGDVELLPGVVGQSARFDGDGDYIAIGQMGATPAQGSIELWFLSEVLQNYRDVFTTGPLGAANGNSAIRFEEYADGRFWLSIGDDTGLQPDFVVVLTPNLVVDTWHHVVVTWDTASGVVNAYLDGARVIVDMANTFWPTQFSDVKIGVGYSSDRFWMGRTDEVAIYEHQLGHARVGAHFWEVAGTFADGFETGETTAWSSTVP